MTVSSARVSCKTRDGTPLECREVARGVGTVENRAELGAAAANSSEDLTFTDEVGPFLGEKPLGDGRVGSRNLNRCWLAFTRDTPCM